MMNLYILLSYGTTGLVLFILMCLMVKHMNESTYDEFLPFGFMYILGWPIMLIHFIITFLLFMREKFGFKKGDKEK